MQLLLVSSTLFNELSSETRSFSHRGNRCSPQQALSLSFPLSQPLPCSLLPCLNNPPPYHSFSASPALTVRNLGLQPHHSFSPSSALPVWLFCLTVSLILWLLEFHAVWFFWHFWLFINFRLFVILLLVVQECKGFLPTPPFWPELSCSPSFLIKVNFHILVRFFR